MRFTERNSPPPFRRRLFPPPFLLLPSDPPRPSPSFVPEEAVVLSFRKRTYVSSLCSARIPPSAAGDGGGGGGREGGREGEKRRGKLNRSREEGTTDGARRSGAWTHAGDKRERAEEGGRVGRDRGAEQVVFFGALNARLRRSFVERRQRGHSVTHPVSFLVLTARWMAERECGLFLGRSRS